MKIVFSLFFVLLFLNIPYKICGQNQESGNLARNKKGVVSVPVVVSDREGRRITGLRKENFTLYRGGVKQNITAFATDDEPVSVALLLDTSGSTQPILDKIKEAAEDFIESLNPNDRCLIATFDSKVNILAAFTSDRNGLKKSLDKIKTAEREGTVLFSAINQIAQSSFAKIQGRKAIVLLSDGNDIGSDISKRELLNTLEESEVSIYPIFFQSGIGFSKPVINSSGTVSEAKTEKGKAEKEPKKQPKQPKKRKKVYSVIIPLPGNALDTEDIKLIDRVSTIGAVNALRELSDLTAGGFYIGDNEKLSSIFKQVAAELKQQYLLSFYLENAPYGTVVRDISVKVDRPNAVVQALTKLRSKEF